MVLINKLFLIIRTVRYLKPIQIVYQIRNRLVKPGNLQSYFSTGYTIQHLKFSKLDFEKKEVIEGVTFNFLNLRMQFKGGIDWGFMGYGKLWNYNLQYFNFLNQSDLSEAFKIQGLRDIYSCLAIGKIKLEPYPVSLRSMNVIRFLCAEKGRIEKYPDVCENLYSELHYLNEHYEYHLLGNHLLENAFCMMMGSCFFNRPDWGKQSVRVLRSQLKEQILMDGGHFERSPMYHQIILFRVLESIDYLAMSEQEFKGELEDTALMMLSWLEQITFRDGNIPHLNDSSPNIAFTTQELKQYARRIGLKNNVQKIALKESGYRKLSNDVFEMVIDVEGIEPSYQPGHAHSDHLSFVLYADLKPFIVDPGISTYNLGERRDWERSSAAHNSVTVENNNVSEVWGGFRVGRRPKIRVISEGSDSVSATENYSIKGLKIQHNRTVKISKSGILITDQINSNSAVGRLHLHPSISFVNTGEDFYFSNGTKLSFRNTKSITIDEYFYNLGYNSMVRAKVIMIFFEKNYSCEIII